MEFSVRTQRANENHFLIRKLSRCSWSVPWVFFPNICSLFALVVLFALSCTEPSPLLSPFCITTLKFCHWFISPEIKVTLMMGSVQSRPFFPPAVQAAHQLYCHTVHFRCVNVCGSEIYLSIFLSIGGIAVYIWMCCLFCVKVSTLTMLYICRWYEISVLGFIVRLVPDGLFAHLPPVHIVMILCFWWCWHIKWRTIYWCKTNHLNLNAALMIFIFFCMQRGALV